MTPAGTINIASHLAVMAHRQPQSAAIIAPSSAKTYTTQSYLELDRRSDAIARGLRTLGIETGTRTAVCLRPGLDFFAVTFALFKLGAVPVLIDPGIGVKNFGRCLAEAEPVAFVGIPTAHAARRLLGWAKKTVRINVTTGWFGGKSLSQIEPLGKVSAARSSDQPEPAGVMVVSAPDDPAAILFTTGSTGPPKGVLYTHGNFDAQVRALRDLYNIKPGEIDLATFPLFGLFGPALGMTTVIPRMDFTRPGFVDPGNIIEPVRQFGVTNLFGSPALLDRVGASQQTQAGSPPLLPSIRRVISAGAPVSAGIIERFTRLLSPGVQVFTPYGATESLPVASIGSNEILSETAKQTDIGKGVCVGKPVNGACVHVIGITDEPIGEWSDLLQLPAGQIGEIVVQGRQVTRTYFNRDVATKLAKMTDSSGGFFHRMGDVGYFDEHGRLWFCGRKSQRVRTPAGDLYSTPFEGVFNTHPWVARSALVGVMREGVTRPVMCIERKPNCPLPEESFCNELKVLAAKFDHTRVVTDFLFHPSFPVDIRHNAKIGREKLAVWAASKMRSRP